jgi:hypothetical protein
VANLLKKLDVRPRRTKGITISEKEQKVKKDVGCGPKQGLFYNKSRTKTPIPEGQKSNP